MNKQELNQKIREINEKKISNGNGFILQGTNKIGNDLLPILQDGEEIVDFCDARIGSLFKFFKGTKYARCYIVITSKRFIYIERGNVIMGLNPLAKKTILIDRDGISGTVEPNSGIEKLTYPYLLKIDSKSGRYEISVADDLNAYLKNKKDSDESEKTKSEQDAGQKSTVNIEKVNPYICNHCGKEIRQDWVQCPYCGKSLNQTGTNDIKNNSKINNISSKKKTVPLVVGGIVALIVVVVVVGNIFPIKNNEEKVTDIADSASNSATENLNTQEKQRIQEEKETQEQETQEEKNEPEIAADIDIAKYVGGNISNLIQVCGDLSTSDGAVYSDEKENIIANVEDGIITAFMLKTEEYSMNFAGVTIGSDFVDISDEQLEDEGYVYYDDDADATVYLYSDQMAGVMFENDATGKIIAIYWAKQMTDILNSEEDTQDSTDEIQYADSEVENFAGEYQGSEPITLYISLGTEVSISEQEAGDVVGTISISTAMGTMQAELWKQDINEYAIYQEEGNAVIGYLTILDNAVIVTDSLGFDGTYELITRYES